MEGRVLRVLVLDGDRPSGLDRLDDLEVQVTYEGRDALMRPGGLGGYRITQYSLELASAATPDQYDVVIIGNNEGYGLHRAAALPDDLKPRTLIVWNRYAPGDERRYRPMGFTHFGQRFSRDGECDLGVKEFIRQVAAGIYGD